MAAEAKDATTVATGPCATRSGPTCLHIWRRRTDEKFVCFEPILRPEDPDAFDCPANDEVCRVCFDGITQAFSKYTFHDEVWNNVQAMQPKDWLAVGLATLVLGLQIADKVVDTILGDVSRAQMQTIPGRSDWSKTKFPLEEVKYTVRRFGITPTVCATAYALVTCRGGGRGQCVPKHGRTRVLDPV